MTEALDDREPTLAVVLERAAARVSDGQAALACAAGIAATAALLLLAPTWWRLACATGAAAAFGAWIIAARSTLPPGVSRIVRGVALVAGVAASFLLGLSLLTRALGIWIS
jgi:hypothetical protein